MGDDRLIPGSIKTLTECTSAATIAVAPVSWTAITPVADTVVAVATPAPYATVAPDHPKIRVLVGNLEPPLSGKFAQGNEFR